MTAPATGPHLSVIVPVYNGERFLAEALNSILRQAYAPLEILVVDDGSTDGSAAIARGFGPPVHYLHQPNQGPAAARNRGLAAATGEIIGFLDADDLWPDDKLHRQLPVVCQHLTDPIALMGHTQRIRLVDQTAPLPTFAQLGEPVLKMVVGAGLYPRTLFDRIGVFDPALRFGEDTDWFFRVREAGIPLCIREEATLIYREHDQNMTLESTPTHARIMPVLQRALARRRQQAAD